MICIDDFHTWRNSITKGKEYKIIKEFPCSITGEPIVSIICDDGQERDYRKSRFIEGGGSDERNYVPGQRYF